MGVCTYVVCPRKCFFFSFQCNFWAIFPTLPLTRIQSQRFIFLCNYLNFEADEIFNIWIKDMYVSSFLFLTHGVGKKKKFSLTNFFSWNQLFSNFFSKNVTFTKFLSKMFERISRFPTLTLCYCDVTFMWNQAGSFVIVLLNDTKNLNILR